MNSALYTNFRRLLERWPLDHTKTGRDLGEYIRSAVGPAIRKSNSSNSTVENINSSITKICSDYYNKIYFVSSKSSSSGLAEAECQQIISNEFLKYLDETEGKSYFKRKN